MRKFSVITIFIFIIQSIVVSQTRSDGILDRPWILPEIEHNKSDSYAPKSIAPWSDFSKYREKNKKTGNETIPVYFYDHGSGIRSIGYDIDSGNRWSKILTELEKGNPRIFNEFKKNGWKLDIIFWPNMSNRIQIPHKIVYDRLGNPDNEGSFTNTKTLVNWDSKNKSIELVLPDVGLFGVTLAKYSNIIWSIYYKVHPSLVMACLEYFSQPIENRGATFFLELLSKWDEEGSKTAKLPLFLTHFHNRLGNTFVPKGIVDPFPGIPVKTKFQLFQADKFQFIFPVTEQKNISNSFEISQRLSHHIEAIKYLFPDLYKRFFETVPFPITVISIPFTNLITDLHPVDGWFLKNCRATMPGIFYSFPNKKSGLTIVFQKRSFGQFAPLDIALGMSFFLDGPDDSNFDETNFWVWKKFKELAQKMPHETERENGDMPFVKNKLKTGILEVRTLNGKSEKKYLNYIGLDNVEYMKQSEMKKGFSESFYGSPYVILQPGNSPIYGYGDMEFAVDPGIEIEIKFLKVYGYKTPNNKKVVVKAFEPTFVDGTYKFEKFD